MNQLKAKKALEAFLIEDIGERDLSTSIFTSSCNGKGRFIAKSEGVFSGAFIISEIYHLLGGHVNITVEKKDGDSVKKGEVIARVEGDITALLSGERVILNLIQRMSGIATMTRQAVECLAGTHIKVCDTRKTMPGLRLFDKYAVTCGGGYNHRFGLYDAVMLKDNHIAYAGSIENAVQMIKEKIGHTVKIEIEVESKTQVEAAVKAGVDIIMLDNCQIADINDFLTLIPRTIITEASGGINLSNLSQYRYCNLDYISLGCLTHSTSALDISFKIEGVK